MTDLAELKKDVRATNKLPPQDALEELRNDPKAVAEYFRYFLKPGPEHPPEVKLWRAVMEHFIETALVVPNDPMSFESGEFTNHQQALHHKQVNRDMIERNSIEFKRMCDAADVDPEFIRNRVMGAF